MSHLSALRAWDLAVPDGGPVHLTVRWERRLRCTDGLDVHRRRKFRAEQPDVVVRAGRPVVRLEQAVIESWPLLADDERRAPAILAVRNRLTLPDRLSATLLTLPNLAGHAELVRLIALLEAGCHSQLEIWGHEEVFIHPSLPKSRAQVPIQLGARTVYLDRYFDAEKVDVELDGRKYHSSPEQREADIRRDAALAAIGHPGCPIQQ